MNSVDARSVPSGVDAGKTGARGVGALRDVRTGSVFMAVLSALTLVALFYLWVLHERSNALIQASAEREVRAILAGIAVAPSGAQTFEPLTGTRVRVLLESTVVDAADIAALANLPRTPGATHAELWPEENPTQLRFVRREADGRVTLVDHSVAAIAPAINNHLARSYLLTGVLLFVFIGGLVWLYRSPRRADAASVAVDANAAAASNYRDGAPKRRNRLPWIVAITVPVFALDVWAQVMPLSGAVYVMAVVASLSSTHAWHTVATAAWTLLLSFGALLLNSHDAPLWSSLSTHGLIAYFIVGAAAFGLALQRRERNESQAWLRAQQARQESEQLRTALARAEAADSRMSVALDRLTLATRYAGISVWEWDLQADLIYAAEGSDFGARLGFNTHLRGGEYVRNFVYAEDRDAFAAAFRAAIVGERPDGQISHRYRSQGVDGTLQYIQLYARVYRNDHGEAMRIVGVDWNVTREVEAAHESERQTEQLRDAERRLERASLSSLEGHWEIDLLSGQPWISTSLRTLLGFAPGEFEGLHLTAPELAHPDDRARQDEAYLAHLQRGAPYDLPLRLRNARGEYRWFRVQGAAERDADGRPVRMSGSVQDIEEQRRAEDALKAAQARFERAVGGTQDGLFDVDLANDTVWFSPRHQEMLGYGNSELQVKASEMLQRVHPDDRQLATEAYLALVKFNTPYNVEYRVLRHDGDYLWVRARAQAEFGRDGYATRFSGSVQDISATRRAHEELVAARDAAAAANQAKSAFLATMSHEIRTPLNGLIGMASLLLDTPLDRTQREYAATIRGSADALLHVLNDILDFSKIEAGKLDIHLTDMDLRAAIEDACATMALQAAANGVELVVDVRGEVPELVRGDAQRIRQCLLNLLSNAVKFTHAGEIVVEACVLAQQSGKTLVQCSVRDTGIGLSDEQMNQLFRPFVQADALTAQRYGGAGLGLSIVKRLVELMGGTVGVDSRHGQGATFWFTLPLEPLDPSGRFARLTADLIGKRILVVDDHAANRRVLGDQLGRVGCEVRAVADGAEALRCLKEACADERPFDAALIDLHMPTMDGAALGEIINADAALGATRLVLLTSLDRVGDQQRFADMGFAAYLTKPVRARELHECLHRVLAFEAQAWRARTQPIVTRSVLTGHPGTQRYGGTVLLVEDNFINRQVAQKYLERLGCRVRTAGDGAAAVDAVRQQRVDLILMDMEMPGMDGLAATQAIRQLERGKEHTPIVAVTAHVMAGQLARCLDAGMDDFLAKPLDVERLREVLDRFGLAKLALESSTEDEA